MSRLVSFLKKLQIGRVLTIFIAGIALFLTTACNNGDMQGARPVNPPVQMGGNNSPYKAGGDGMNNYRMSTDPKAQNPVEPSGDRADLSINFNQLIAVSDIKSNASDILYPGENATRTNNPTIGARGEAIDAKTARQIPAPHQGVIDRSDPNEKILEKIGQQFEDASGFLRDLGESGTERPELQNNPALGK